jgi:hypothetical protein
LRLRLVLFLGDAIDFDLVALAAGDEQEQQGNEQQTDGFEGSVSGGNPGFFCRITLHNAKY